MKGESRNELIVITDSNRIVFFNFDIDSVTFINADWNWYAFTPKYVPSLNVVKRNESIKIKIK